jgi:hypothetical protein
VPPLGAKPKSPGRGKLTDLALQGAPAGGTCTTPCPRQGHARARGSRRCSARCPGCGVPGSRRADAPRQIVESTATDQSIPPSASAWANIIVEMASQVPSPRPHTRSEHGNNGSITLHCASVNTASRITPTTLAHNRHHIRETRPSRVEHHQIDIAEGTPDSNIVLRL